MLSKAELNTEEIVTIDRQNICIYIIKTNNNPDHHGFHTNTSPYVLTTDPYPGDEIVYVLRGQVEKKYEGIYLTEGSFQLGTHSLSSSVGEKTKIRILSHLGRSTLLGEDSAEEAFGNDCLVELVVEILNGKDWNYAPCEIEIIPKPDHKDKDGFTSREWWEWICFDEIKLEFSEEFGWQKVDLVEKTKRSVERHLLESREDYLRKVLRGKVASLSEQKFVVVKKIATESVPDKKEWIEREEGKKWAENPVAMAFYDIIKSQILADMSKSEIADLAQKHLDSCTSTVKYSFPEEDGWQIML